MKKIYTTELPFPPSVNSLYGGGSKQRRFKSKQYKEWLKACPALVLAEGGAIEYPVKVRYTFYFPDKRRRDLSNYHKAPEDYIVAQCVLVDDDFTIVQENSLKYGGIDRDNPRVLIEIYKI